MNTNTTALFRALIAVLYLAAGASPGVHAATCAKSVPQGLNGLAGFYTTDDRRQHAIVANDGDLHELFFTSGGAPSSARLGRLPETVAVGGYHAPLDAQRRVAIVARRNGEIHQVYFNSSGINSTLLGRVNDPVDVTGFYASSNGTQRAVVLSASGEIVEFAWLPGQGVRRTTLTNFPGIRHIAGFFAKDDQNNILLMATSSGDVWEAYYRDPADFRGSRLASFNEEIVDLGAFYTDDDHYRHGIVATRGGLHEIYYHPSIGIQRSPLWTRGGIRQVGAYASTEHDRVRHVFAGLDNGEIWEVTFEPGVGISNRQIFTFARAYPFVEDPSVDTPNNAPQPFRASSAGLTTKVAGDQNELYAVSLNAGIWKSTNSGPWSQLQTSPPLAYSLAVDPTLHQHLAVGERRGDSAQPLLDRSGVWESFGGGGTWVYSLDPRTLGCPGQAVPSVAFAAGGDLFAATECGVARKRWPADFELMEPTRASGAVTAVTTRTVNGQSWIWARTMRRLLLSRDGGDTWQTLNIPASVNGRPIIWGLDLDGFHRGDPFGLAAWGTSAVMVVSTADTLRVAVLSYDGQAGVWSLSETPAGSGTGLGGRRNIKAYEAPHPGVPWALFLSAAQNVYLGLPSGGAIQWRQVAESNWDPNSPAETFQPPSAVHTDFWDIHVGSGANPPVWLTTDGGVYRASFLDLLNTPPGSTTSPPWQHQNQGLRTHHVHTLSLITEGPTRRSKTVYSTSDNDEWLSNSSAILAPRAPWRTWAELGDANGTYADSGSSPIALIFRNIFLNSLTSFGDPLPVGAQPWISNPNLFSRYPGDHFPAGKDFEVIQTLKDEPPSPLLDVVMLARTPAGSPSPTGQPILVRNRRYSASPGYFSSADWQIEDSALPAGAVRVWASGGHQNPVFYIYTNNAGRGQVFRRDGVGSPWRELLTAGPLLPGLHGGTYGPVYPNPYNPNHLLVLTTRGVEVSWNGGTSFSDDIVLTALITESGKYPLTHSFGGGNNTNIDKANRANPMATLSQVAFFRDDPGKMVAASPYTGAFYRDESCGFWQSLTSHLPHPLPAVASVGIDHEAIYVATEGRSILKLRAYEFSRPAAYFTSTGLAGLDLARVLDAASQPVAGAQVRVELRNTQGANVFLGTLTTDSAGVVRLPPISLSGTHAAHLELLGNSQAAPASTSRNIYF